MKHAKQTKIAMAVVLSTLTLALGLSAQDQSGSPSPVRHHMYQVVDLGTFGGAASYINEPENGGPFINARGDVVAAAENTDPLSAVSNPYECFPGPNVDH